MATDPTQPSPFRQALAPAALRDAMVLRRPVFANPWDSTEGMFLCFFAVSVFDPLLLWLGGVITGAIFGFSSHWRIGVFMVAALVGAAGFMTIVGRQRTRLSVDFLAIAAWIVLGLIVAPIIGLAPPTGVAIALYAVVLVGILGFVLFAGHFQTAFLRTVSWPITWTILALFFAWAAHRLILYQ
ncbi:MAG TPA: hypothetical protein VMF57_21240 [Solirubrobacteraceae bacterium]|nr:hypothetical protein [Solirubrobacteraceae bacterium]